MKRTLTLQRTNKTHHNKVKLPSVNTLVIEHLKVVNIIFWSQMNTYLLTLVNIFSWSPKCSLVEGLTIFDFNRDSNHQERK